jgi:hypothetical protein
MFRNTEVRNAPNMDSHLLARSAETAEEDA